MKKQLLITMMAGLGIAVGVSFTPTHAHAISYNTAVNRGVNFIKYHTKKSQLDSWDALAIRRSPKKMTKAWRQLLYRNIKSDFKELDGHYAATDYEKALIGTVAVGANPTKFQGKNLVNGVIKTAPKSGINGQIYGVIALSTKNYGKKSNATVKKLVGQIVKSQNSAGGWSFGTSKSDADITGMALQALAMHPTYKGVKGAVSKANSMLKRTAFLKNTGGFLIKGSFTKQENSNSNAMVLAGLAANKINVAKEYHGNHGANPVSRLIQFQKKSGQFRWLLNSNKGALYMATQQSVYSLEQYQYYRAGKGSIYKF
ncbi:hypothetical protein [Lentilactobacillus sp. Marseille-Q4993]|uniref:hypothetical protein n=1 Tax=Lentilactobacillus sp. Marseille-Q4993 TaxID=3039492 RepID=UPI0024BCFE75|nr:hypothetical protein [Lentilactobacillus sp. Marseille-Q4993]